MSNFIQDCLNADAILEEIDDYVEKWHNSIQDVTVHEFLGMTEEEYFLWVDNDFMLKFIIKAHQENKSIDEILELEHFSDIKMAARSRNATEAREIYNWLLAKGKIKDETK